jgi:hypothetical protein
MIGKDYLTSGSLETLEDREPESDDGLETSQASEKDRGDGPFKYVKKRRGWEHMCHEIVDGRSC